MAEGPGGRKAWEIRKSLGWASRIGALGLMASMQRLRLEPRPTLYRSQEACVHTHPHWSQLRILTASTAVYEPGMSASRTWKLRRTPTCQNGIQRQQSKSKIAVFVAAAAQEQEQQKAALAECYRHRLPPSLLNPPKRTYKLPRRRTGTQRLKADHRYIYIYIYAHT